MNKKIITTLFLSCLAAGFVLWSEFAPASNATSNPQNQSRPSHKPTEIPQHVFYGEVFSLLAKLKNTADYQRQALLSDHEVALLKQIASDCESEVSKQDAKAEIFSEAFRQKLISKKPTKQPMPVPAELTELQEQRDAIVIRHRDRLRKELGEDAFNRFTEAAKYIVHITLKPIH